MLVLALLGEPIELSLEYLYTFDGAAHDGSMGAPARLLRSGGGRSEPNDQSLAVLELSPSQRTDFFFFLFLYALFVLVGVIVLLNLLIAMMTNTYHHRQEEATLHWRVFRARQILRLEMFCFWMEKRIGHIHTNHYYYKYMFETHSRKQVSQQRRMDSIEGQLSEIKDMLLNKNAKAPAGNSHDHLAEVKGRSGDARPPHAALNGAPPPLERSAWSLVDFYAEQRKSATKSKSVRIAE